MQYLTYRKDIDGLRAFAVIIVLLFHLDINFFSGGFIGVDIFFVISGYLITSIILKDLKENTFNIFSFLIRRVKRLIPALIFVMVFSLIAGWFLLLPYDYKALGQQIVAQSFLLSNVLFYLQSGYFDSANDTKILLHTWSLSLEWQFYITAVFLFFIIWHVCRQYLLKFTILVFIISFTFSIYTTKNYPDFAFYMLPSRLWEFLVGALIVFTPEIKLNKITSQILAIASLTTLAAIATTYTSYTNFPGLAALPVCLATAILIFLDKTNPTIISKYLSKSVVVFIGLISYSLYLWHWPLIVLTKYYNYGELSTSLTIIVLSVSFILAWITWKFIENPLRKTNDIKALSIMAMLSVILIIIGFTLHLQSGHEVRFDVKVITYVQGSKDKNQHQQSCNQPNLEDIHKGNICQTNVNNSSAKDFVLWGG